jgi:hypothetical protein
MLLLNNEFYFLQLCRLRCVYQFQHWRFKYRNNSIPGLCLWNQPGENKVALLIPCNLPGRRRGRKVNGNKCLTSRVFVPALTAFPSTFGEFKEACISLIVAGKNGKDGNEETGKVFGKMESSRVFFPAFTGFPSIYGEFEEACISLMIAGKNRKTDNEETGKFIQCR